VGPAARGDVPPRARGPLLRRAGRGAPGVGRAPDPGGLSAPRRNVAAGARADSSRGGPTEVRSAPRSSDHGRLSPHPNPLPHGGRRNYTTSYLVGTIVIELRGGRVYFRFWRRGSLISVCGTCWYGISDRKWLIRFRCAERLLSVSTTYHGASLMSHTANILSF